MSKKEFFSNHGVTIIGIIVSVPAIILSLDMGDIFGVLGILCLWVACIYEILEVRLK